MIRSLLTAVVLIVTLVGVALVEEVAFSRRATAAEVAVITRDAKDILDGARKAEMPVDVWVGQIGGLTAFRIETQAYCGTLLGCPVFVYDRLDEAPIYRGMAQEVMTWPPR